VKIKSISEPKFYAHSIVPPHLYKMMLEIEYCQIPIEICGAKEDLQILRSYFLNNYEEKPSINEFIELMTDASEDQVSKRLVKKFKKYLDKDEEVQIEGLRSILDEGVITNELSSFVIMSILAMLDSEAQDL
jgi:hypothetical protein